MRQPFLRRTIHSHTKVFKKTGKIFNDISREKAYFFPHWLHNISSCPSQEHVDSNTNEHEIPSLISSDAKKTTN